MSEASSTPNKKAPNLEWREWIGQTLGMRYQIRSALGRGGMGMVFEAEQLDLQRPVAIKILTAEQTKKQTSVRRFENEARTAGVVSHPNICAVYDLGTLPSGSPYLVMERLFGEPLSQRIGETPNLPIAFCLGVILDMLAGLAAAHQQHIIHRDIKPENIFLCDKPRRSAKLVDFGVSKFLHVTDADGEEEEELALTRTGMVMGTPYYMSAEQARGFRDLDERVDVYAAGVVLYEMLTGKRPHVAPNYNALLMQIVTTPPKPATQLRPEIPKEVEAVLQTAMERHREKRYRTAEEFRKAILRVTKSLRIKPTLDPLEEQKKAAQVSPKIVITEPDEADFEDGPTHVFRNK
jgi:eukaryotic-like serine/threonine-protein kinase